MTPVTQRRLFRRAAWMIGILVLLMILYALIKGPSQDLTRYTLERQSASFLLVSTLKSSLAMIEGSDIGIGFRFEVGDIIQSTYDLVDFTWKMLLYGILLITFSKIFHESNLVDLGIFILGAGFAIRIASLFFERYREKMISIGSGVIVAGLIASFYVPVSTVVSFRACEYFVDHIEKDLDAQLEAVIEDWEQFKADISLTEYRSTLRSGAQFLKELFLKLTRILITYTCLIMIRYLLFPVVVAYGFYVICKSFLKRKLEHDVTAS